MKACVLHQAAPIADRPLVWGDVPTPVPGPGELLIRVHACGVCRTDLHVVEGELSGGRLPIIPGHQIVGTVQQVAPDVAGLSAGARVGVAWLGGTCGSCRYCRRGSENLCEKAVFTGYTRDGGYAEYAVALADFVYPLPEAISDEQAAPLLCAGIIGYRALERAQVPPGGKLLLVGFSSSAHVTLQIALYRGHDVFVVTRSEGHMQTAREMGAAWAGADTARLPSKMDSAVLFAPAGHLVPPIMSALERGGTLSIAGIHLTDVPPLQYQEHLFYDKQIRSVAANTREDGRRMLAEAVRADVKPQVTTYRLAHANLALQDMKHSRIEGTGVLMID